MSHHKLASIASLEVKSAVADLGDVQANFIQSLVAEWEKGFNKASNESNRGDRKLERLVQDHFNTTAKMGSKAFNEFLGFMSNDLRNQTSYGMLIL